VARLRLAVLAVVVAWLAQALVVQGNHGGNWTALFVAGEVEKAVPPGLAWEQTWRWPGGGYDGQAYHVIAHDPFLTRGYHSALDAPAYRYQRALLPLLAWVTALGRDSLIDFTLFAWQLVFLGAGVYWLAGLLESYALPRWPALALLLLPATLSGLFRMTMDGAFCALCCGFALARRRGRFGWALAAASVSVMTKETGLLLIATLAVDELLARRWRRVLVAPLPLVIPALWLAFVLARTGDPAPHGQALNLMPALGWFTRFTHPVAYPGAAWIRTLLEFLDYLSLAAFPCAWYLTARLPRQRLLPAALFALLPVIIYSQDVWSESQAFARVFSPLFLLLVLEQLPEWRWRVLAPVVMLSARLWLEDALPLAKAARHLLLG